jgi:hypothetical protein
MKYDASAALRASNTLNFYTQHELIEETTVSKNTRRALWRGSEPVHEPAASTKLSMQAPLGTEKQAVRAQSAPTGHSSQGTRTQSRCRAKGRRQHAAIHLRDRSPQRVIGKVLAVGLAAPAVEAEVGRARHGGDHVPVGVANEEVVRLRKRKPRKL